MCRKPKIPQFHSKYLLGFDYKRNAQGRGKRLDKDKKKVKEGEDKAWNRKRNLYSFSCYPGTCTSHIPVWCIVSIQKENVHLLFYLVSILFSNGRHNTYQKRP